MGHASAGGVVSRRSEQPPSRAVIVAVGSEMLTPHKTDTNSLFLTGRLNAIGISVVQKLVVGDDRSLLGDALRYGMQQGDLLIVTGGLGPTEDDVTREVAATVLDRPLVEVADIVDALRARFASRGLDMPEVNRRQAQVPRGADIIDNPRGTAPGLWMTHDSVVVMLLPGPPRELQPMFDQVVAERLASRVGARRVYRRVLRTTGGTESHIDEQTKPIYSRWWSYPEPIETTILASLGQIDLHLSITSEDAAAADRALDRATVELADVLGSRLVSTDGRSLPQVVGELLRACGKRVAVAESCTGGLTTSRLTDVPGSSAYVHAGWVVYSNEAKIALLGISRSLLDEHGAVSDPAAEAMAVAARDRADVDYGLAVTGIAGPGGGSADKPVGTVCLALASRGGTPRVRRVRLPGERDRVKFQASQAALDMLRRALLREALVGSPDG